MKASFNNTQNVIHQIPGINSNFGISLSLKSQNPKTPKPQNPLNKKKKEYSKILLK